MMKRFEILRELQKCDIEIQSEQMLLEKCLDGLAHHKVAAKLQFIKNTISVKHNEACAIK